MLNKIWRYSINLGEHGGIVIADTAEEAKEKILKSWKHTRKLIYLRVWEMENDDCFDKENPDVLECYGL